MLYRVVFFSTNVDSSLDSFTKRKAILTISDYIYDSNRPKQFNIPYFKSCHYSPL